MCNMPRGGGGGGSLHFQKGAGEGGVHSPGGEGGSASRAQSLQAQLSARVCGLWSLKRDTVIVMGDDHLQSSTICTKCCACTFWQVKT
jgi:hypothetical protein